ncbi:hypothetical protein [Vibrio mediterranei]|uniref:hypothetical protein n=1 Tax=Vibrio mediterranei TaxID=689 RepID=UPI004068B7DD
MFNKPKLELTTLFLKPKQNVDNYQTGRLGNVHIGYGKEQFVRQESIRIETEGGHWVVRKAKGNPGLKGLTNQKIGLDGETLSELRLKRHDSDKVTVRKANLLDCYLYQLKHTDSQIRMQAWIATASAIIALIGIVK